METRIFWIGLGCGAASLLLRWALLRPRSTWWGRILRRVREWTETGFAALMLAFIIMSFVVQAFKIPSGSMKDTLFIGDHLFVNKFIYGLRIPFTDIRVLGWRSPRRGEILVFKFPEDPSKDFIKRCIGLPGETVEVRQKRVFINGEALEEPYVIHGDPSTFFQPRRDNFGPLTVPPGHYFMMGDNRDFSLDSRFWGPLPDKEIKGQAWFIYWPMKRFGIVQGGGMTKTWMVWLTMALVMFLIEVMSPTAFFFACLGAGALAATVASLAVETRTTLWVVFFAVSIIAVVASRPFARRFAGRASRATHMDELIGQIARVTEAIDPDARKGTVTVGGEKWRAEARERIESGAKVIVDRVEGTHVEVHRA